MERKVRRRKERMEKRKSRRRKKRRKRRRRWWWSQPSEWLTSWTEDKHQFLFTKPNTICSGWKNGNSLIYLRIRITKFLVRWVLWTEFILVHTKKFAKHLGPPELNWVIICWQNCFWVCPKSINLYQKKLKSTKYGHIHTNTITGYIFLISIYPARYSCQK